MFLASVLAAAAIAAPTTEPATDVAATSATLNGTVDGATTEHFEYGTTTAYGLTTAPQAVTDGAVSAPVTGLTVDTVYHYRIVADTGVGEDRTFRTAGPPAVSDQLSRDITPDTATVSASIDTKGIRTSYRIQWGTSTGYGRYTPVVSADSGTVTATATLTGLRPNTRYHWRTRASNAAGTTLGADRTFKTGPLPTSVTIALSRGTVTWGGGTAVGGRVTGSGVAGLTVALEHQRFPLDQEFQELSTARTGKDGGYVFLVDHLWSTTRYRVVTRTTVAAVSPVVTARSAVKVGARARHHARRRARIEGSILPEVHGTASLQRRIRGRGWVQVGKKSVRPADDVRSRYRFGVWRPRRGRAARIFRVVVAPVRGAHVRGTSRVVKVRPRTRR
jgi:hypothetical protein